VVRSLDVVWLAAHFAKVSALNDGKLGMLKANSSATDIELRAGAGKEVGRASDVRKRSKRPPVNLLAFILVRGGAEAAACSLHLS